MEDNMVWQTLVHTPWWVYLILVYCIHRGIKATKARVIDLRKAWILPAVFLGMGIHTVVADLDLTLSLTAGFILLLIIGGVLGFWQTARASITAAEGPYQLKVPGAWTSLVMILLIFAVKYYFGFEQAVNPAIAQKAWFRWLLVVITGGLTSWFAGRYLGYCAKLKAMK